MLCPPGTTASAGALPHVGLNLTARFIPSHRRRWGEGSSCLGLLCDARAAQACRAARFRCAAAALSLPLQPSEHSTSSSNAAGANTLPLASSANPRASTSDNDDDSNRNNSSSNNSAVARAAASTAITTNAAVAAKFPAVPTLPTPPGSGNLQDVVPYLIRLAIQERHLAWRLAAAMSCMVVAKLAGISLPLAFKSAVDALSVSGSAAVMAQAALAAVLSYGALDCVRVMAKEAQSPIFAPVSQAVTRRVAYHTFAHVLSLDTRFHTDRRTGRMSRILERGTRSIAVLYRALIFTFLPTGLELGAVAALLAARFGAQMAAILSATFAAYVAWTVVMTQRATDVRKEVNHFDNQASSKAVDALLNFETVTLFNNQRLEVSLYDRLLRDLRAASLRAETLSAALNSGQGLILAAGMAAILAAVISSGSATGGDLVMTSGLIVQLWAPLQFLGWFYRELRAALVDMEEFFQILRTPSVIKDGGKRLPLASGSEEQQQQQQEELEGAAAAAAPSTGSSSDALLTSDHATQGSDIERLGSSSHSSGSSSSSRSDAEGPTGQLAPTGGLFVELVDVSFGYTPERQILRGVSLRVAPGESVAVVGSSGSGKSTILKLVTRLYDVWPHQAAPHRSAAGDDSSSGNGSSCSTHHLTGPSVSESGRNGSSIPDRSCSGDSAAHAREASASLQNGTSSTICSSGGNGGSSTSSGGGGSEQRSGVYINGVDVRQLQLADLRSAIAVVPQDTALYYDSIRENIRYGRPDAGDEEVEAAARMARLHDTVMALPEQYDTLVGERGLKLSGGEKQRVAIARAFLRSPRLLICDEATSALDSGTEVAIMDSLKELARGRSALFVAHRLSTVRNCDRIVVLRSGVVVEEGSHEELMARGGEYAAMWELQANQQTTAAGRAAGDREDGGMTDSDAEMDDSEEEEQVVVGRQLAAQLAATDLQDDVSVGAAAEYIPRAATSVAAAPAARRRRRPPPRRRCGAPFTTTGGREARARPQG